MFLPKDPFHNQGPSQSYVFRLGLFFCFQIQVKLTPSQEQRPQNLFKQVGRLYDEATVVDPCP